MEIKIKGRDNIIFNKYNDFFNYVNTYIIKNLNNDFDDKLKYYYNNNILINGIKKFKIEIKLLYFNKTILNIDYWVSRGWSIIESKEKIKNEQIRRSHLSKDKMLKLKKDNYDDWCSNYNTKKEFYIKRGLIEKDAKKELSKRQKTFSLDICISKYGDIGYDIWKKRQNKWVNTMNNISFNTDSNSILFFKNKFGNNWLYNSINQSSFLNKKLIINIIKISGDNFEKFIEEYNNRKTIISLNDIYFIYNSKYLQHFFNINKSTMIKISIKKLKIIITKYGNIRYFNGHICRSNGEYYIAKKLKKLNIEYIYEKKYPNSNYICDFYIPKYDLYVEYMGVLKNDFIKKTYTNFYKKYKEKYINKEKYCKLKKLNYLYDNNMVEIIKKLKIIENDRTKN